MRSLETRLCGRDGIQGLTSVGRDTRLDVGGMGPDLHETGCPILAPLDYILLTMIAF
jgi:hypothetical protein